MYGPQSPPHGGPTQPAATHGAQVPGQAQSATQYSGGQNQTGSNGPPPQQPGRDNRALLTEQEESYADPPRAWKRAGSLLGSWAVVWASILIAGLVFDGLVDRTRDSAFDEAAEHPNQTAWRVMQFSFNGELERADDLLCSDFEHLKPKELQQQLSKWEKDSGVRSNTSVGFADESDQASSEHGTFLMEVEIEAGDSFETWYYEVTVEEDGASYCVAKIAQNATME